MNENKRRCAKCGDSPREKPDTVLHRFPRPGRTNIDRCTLWAKYCFPHASWSSLEFLFKLHTKHKMLCNKHFKKQWFIDPVGTRLFKSAVPDVECDKVFPVSTKIEPGAGPSLTQPLMVDRNLTIKNQIIVHGTVTTQPITRSTIPLVKNEVKSEYEKDEMEVVIEEFGGEEQDSDESEDDDDDDNDANDAALELKVANLKIMIKTDPYSYNHHIELVKTLWALSDVDRWRAASDDFIRLMALKPADWLLRLRTEMSIVHSHEAPDRIAKLFEAALEDCYSVEILNEWCSWSLGYGNSPPTTRQQLARIIECAGADPRSGKLYWDALYRFEKTQLEEFDKSDVDTPEYKKQRYLVCRCLEELVSRPLMGVAEAWPIYEHYAKDTFEHTRMNSTRKCHEIALEFLQKLTPFEDRLLTLEKNTEEKLHVYEEYLEEVTSFSVTDKYKPFHEATVKAIYERAITECPTLPLLLSFASHAQQSRSGASSRRTLRVCARRNPRTHHFWTLMMQQAERDCDVDELHSSLEAALLRGMETYKEGERLWLGYIEYKRRQTNLSDPVDVAGLRSTFRLAWDSLATCYGVEANDCQVPLFWARLEYGRMNSPKEGREVFDEIFKYGDNNTKYKYWKALLRFEIVHSSSEVIRDLFRKALEEVTDYPAGVAALWIDYERDYGSLDTMIECKDASEKRIKKWRANHKSVNENMANKNVLHPKYKDNEQGNLNKKTPGLKIYVKNTSKNITFPRSGQSVDIKQTDKTFSKPTVTELTTNRNEEGQLIRKRKIDPLADSEIKRERDGDMDVDEPVQSSSSVRVERSPDDVEGTGISRGRMKNTPRHCAKCGKSRAKYPNLHLYRFPKPDSWNIRRIEAWAKFIHPDENWRSNVLHEKLHSTQQMLCDDHFDKDSFIDYSSRKLFRYAVPCDNDCKQLQTSASVIVDTG